MMSLRMHKLKMANPLSMEILQIRLLPVNNFRFIESISAALLLLDQSIVACFKLFSNFLNKLRYDTD